MKKTVQTPHDRFFRAALSDQRVANEFFECHLPPAIKEIVDLASITLRKDTYVDENLSLSMTDMLFDASFQGKSGYLYLLIEHQSTPNRLMAFRLLKYMLAIMDQHLKTTKGTQLPLIYPMVFYTGKTSYSYSTDIFDLFEPVSQELARDIFMQPFELIEINQIPDEEMKQRVWLGILELSMKHIFARDILPCLNDMLSLLQKAEDLRGAGYVQTALTYLFITGEVKDKQLFLETIQTGLSPETKGAIMTIAEQFAAEGMEKGIQLGIQQGEQQGIKKGIEKGDIGARRRIAKKSLREGLPLEAVSRITDLSIEELKLLMIEKNN